MEKTHIWKLHKWKPNRWKPHKQNHVSGNRKGEEIHKWKPQVETTSGDPVSENLVS